MGAISINVAGKSVELPSGATAFDAVGNTNRTVVVARINNELRDLSTVLQNGDSVEAVGIDSEEGLAVLRHSAAHVTAQAVQDLFPQTRLGIGPPIKDGFYYDFMTQQPFTPEDVTAIENRMVEIIKSGQKFSRRVISEKEALAELANEPFKLELIAIKGGVDSDVMEVGGVELSIYDNVDGKTGEKCWGDLCRGPHVPDTKYIQTNAFKLMRTAAAYWRGSEKNPQLQRIYGTAWPTKDGLRAHLEAIAEAERRDHRRLGTELDLFSCPEEIGSGLAVFHPNGGLIRRAMEDYSVFHPKGGIIRRAMEDYSRSRHEDAGYEFVYTPHITKSNLFETSGHLDFYRDGMFPPMRLDEERDENGEIKRQGQDYFLKPMNCPFHNLIYKSRGRSYRELPLRLFEFGSVYRYEKSGVVHGLTRVRGMTQDDAHIYCSREQMQDELKDLLKFVLQLLRDYGLNDFYLELSTRNEEKFVGSDEDWAEATAALEEAAKSSGLDLVPDPGGAAFYGPKISVQARDAIGRTWQMSTIQVDFQMGKRFDLEYTASDGTRQQPIMIHRALFGSIERFFGVLLEHYAGAFPAWLSPVQVVGIPVAAAHQDYLFDVAQKLKSAGIRVEVDSSDERMQKKIRTAQQQKVPFMLIVGDEDVEKGAVSFRYRNGEQKNGVLIADAIAEIVAAVESRG
ncbi:MAG: threonine--tRNA ligase [Actinobacteria bacterium]|nr:threonine--tRNA ligase [Actinomycetota bacterium]